MFVLDEIDRLDDDDDDDDDGVRAALLEAVAPAPGAAFRDHYLDLPLDLSDAVFVATANSLGAVPRMWRERMSVLDLPGYTEREKRVIATRHLLPWQLAPHGLTAAALRPRRSTVVLPPPARPTAIARSPSRHLVC